VQTDRRPVFSRDWTHVVAVGPHILFVRNDGLFAVGHINESDGKYVETQDGTLVDKESGTTFTNSTHVVAVGSRVLLGRNDEFWVIHIDEADSQYVRTQKAPGFSPDWTHVVAVGPRILYVASAGGLGAVGHINWIGQHVETQSGPIYSIDWDHVVAVA
jgi:sporulation protein YlmC with PRC-barrel domain